MPSQTNVEPIFAHIGNFSVEVPESCDDPMEFIRYVGSIISPRVQCLEVNCVTYIRQALTPVVSIRLIPLEGHHELTHNIVNELVNQILGDIRGNLDAINWLTSSHASLVVERTTRMANGILYDHSTDPPSLVEALEKQRESIEGWYLDGSSN